MTARVLLALAILALLSGPLAYRMAERSRALRAAVDGFSIVTVASLALLELAPHALAEAGLWGFVPLVLGFVIPTWLHRLEALGRFSDHVLVFALLLHSAIEAAALGTAAPPQAEALGLAILAHQLPVGLAAYSVSTSRKTGWLVIVSLSVAMVAGFSSGQWASDIASSGQIAWLEALAAGSLLHVLSSHEYDPPPNYPFQNVRSHLARLEPPPLFGSATFEFSSDPLRVPFRAAPVDPLTLVDQPPSPLSLSIAGDSAHRHGHGVRPESHAHGHGHAHGATPLGLGHAHGGHAHGSVLRAGGTHGVDFESTEHPVPFRSALFHTTPASRAAGIGALLGLGLVFLHPGEHAVGEEAVEHLSFLSRLYEFSARSAPAILLGYLLVGAIGLIVTEKPTSYLRRGTRIEQAMRAIAFGLPLPICACGVLPVYESLIRRGVPWAAAVAFLVATPELGFDAILLSFPLLGAPLALLRVGGALLVAIAVALIVAPLSERQPSTSDPPPEPARSRSVSEALRFGLVEMFDHTMPWILFGLTLGAVSLPLLGHEWVTEMSPLWQVPLFAMIGMPLYVCAAGATPLAAAALGAGISPGAALAFLLTSPATNTTAFLTLTRIHGARLAVLFGASVAALSIAMGYLANALVPETHPPALLHLDGPTLLEKCALGALLLLTLLSLLRQGPRGMLGQILHALR
jgi:uncharacterized membrane protein YraQ (UPF0718 family)